MNKRRFFLSSIFIALLTFTIWITPAQAQVDMNLVLAIDISASITGDGTGMPPDDQFAVQRQGYIDAFNNALLFQAIQNAGPNQAIGVSLVYWAEDQVQAIDWFRIDSFATSQQFAQMIADDNGGVRRSLGTETGLGDALAFSGSLFSSSPFSSDKWVIDISGDGTTNYGNGDSINGQANSEAATEAGRLAALNAGVTTINGITVEANNFVQLHYQNFVIGGFMPQHFHAETFDDFGNILFQKLLFEINQQPPPTTNAPVPEPMTVVLLGSGMLGAAFVRKKRKV